MYVAQELLDSVHFGAEESHALLAQAEVSSLRLIATNNLDLDSLEILTASLESARKAMAAAGFGKEFRLRLKREDSAKYDLVTHILPGLWCGGWSALNDDAFVLKQKKITHVLSVHSATTQRRLPPFITGQMLVTVNDTDDADLLVHFPAICDFISAARADGGSVFVHCGAGISRAPTCIAAYIMKTGNLLARPALALVKKHRRNARPNPGFLQQLNDWEKAVVTAPAVPASPTPAIQELDMSSIK